MTESSTSLALGLGLPELVTVTGGSFLMGNVAGRPDERPAHRVELSPFRVALEPVTNAEYAIAVGELAVPAPAWLRSPGFGDPRQPVVGINWFEAVAYCQWLAARTGIPFRLPTEAEREFAALGGEERADWPWPGTEHPIAEELAAFEAPHIPRPECANGYSLRCMAENVHEWCSDWYAADYYVKSPVEAPTGPPGGVRKASRGGAWRHSVKVTRVSARSSIPPELRYNDYGFRLFSDA